MKDLIQRSIILNKEIESTKLGIEKDIQDISSITNRMKARLTHLEHIVGIQNGFLTDSHYDYILSEVNKEEKEKPSHEGHDYQPTHDH